jgi:hypothetical protein
LAVGDVWPKNVCWISRRAAASSSNRAGGSTGAFGEVDARGPKPAQDSTLEMMSATTVDGARGFVVSGSATVASTARVSTVGDVPATRTVALSVVERDTAGVTIARVPIAFDDGV